MSVKGEGEMCHLSSQGRPKRSFSVRQQIWKAATCSWLSLSAQRGHWGPEQAVRILFRDSKMKAVDMEEKKRKKKKAKVQPHDEKY